MRRALLSLLPLLLLLTCAFSAGPGAAGLEEVWDTPPPEARLRAYWWWLNGNVTREAISRDLQQMKEKGFGGAILCDAGGAEQWGNDRVPAGPVFASPEWKALYRHALDEASRLGLEISLSIQSGWNLGGPMIKPSESVKKLVWSETLVKGPGLVRASPLRPKAKGAYYEDLFLIACKRRAVSGIPRQELANLRVKTLEERIRFTGPDAWFLSNSAPDTRVLWQEEEPVPGEADSSLAEVIDLTGRLDAHGVVEAELPPGEWLILRFGCTLADHNEVSTASEGWKGLAMDPLDPVILRKYWDSVVVPLLDEAGPHVGRTLRYLHTDSWEVDHFNWTPTLREEFIARRGYDPLPWMPVFSGLIVGDRQQSNRFLHDYRKTLGDLAVDNHYRLLSKWSAERGLGIHPEAGGPHFTPIDAQRCLGATDIPMAEFWAESATHRTSDATRFFIKQPASAAHTYGKRIVAAEGFTTIGPHWQERLWNNLKPSFDHAACEGLNRLVWHAFVCSPEETGIPGQQYFAGTHLNPKVTWWEKSGAFFDYLNRCQAMLQRGLPVADVLYYYGDHVPNFAQSRASDPAKIGMGYEYDVITEEALLNRVATREGKLLLPDGMQYRVLVLPPAPEISLPVLRRVNLLVEAGAKVVGPRPKRASGLVGHPSADREVEELTRKLWGDGQQPGRIPPGSTALDALKQAGAAPDFETMPRSDGRICHVHRLDGETDIYFVTNRDQAAASFEAIFRVQGKEPELWDPVTGKRSLARAWRTEAGRTVVPLHLPPCGSLFVVFRKSTTATAGTESTHAPELEESQTIEGPWRLNFDPKWGGPESIVFDHLVSWSNRRELGIKFYSGTVRYTVAFLYTPDSTQKQPERLFLDLGDVRELADLTLNGKKLGTLWAPPFQAEVTEVLKDGENTLELEVVNFWPNRLIGDQVFRGEKTYTRTNIKRLTKDSHLMESGLLGPVRLLRMKRTPTH